MAAPAAGIGPRPAPIILNLNPVIPVVVQMISEMNLGGMFKTALDCVDSNPLANVSLVTLKCYPIVEMGDRPLVQRLDNELSARLRYLEAFMTGTASLVYNVVFGLIFSVISIAALGQARAVAAQMKKHWIHTALAVASVGIAAAGAFSPRLGQEANIVGGLAIVVLMGVMAQADVLRKLTETYDRHRNGLKQAVIEGLRGDVDLFNREFFPLFHYLDQRHDIQTIRDLTEVAQQIAARFPSFIPLADPNFILEQLERLYTGSVSIS